MPILIATVLLQITCIVHVIRTRRNTAWIMAIGFLPLVGSIAYFVVEIMPGMGNNRRVQAARGQISQFIDPERSLREAMAALELVDTPANRVAAGNAYAGLGRHANAIPEYRKALERGADPAVTLKLAASLFETGANDAALAALDGIEDSGTTGERDRRLLLKARLFETLNRKAEAEMIYADIVTRLPGEEARCRYAALLLERGATAPARVLLEEVEVRMKRLDRLQRAPDADMYSWAMVELGKLRR
jgi:hypothetical protein